MYDVVDRFLRYAKIHTTSDEASESCPSTPWQWDLANLLVQEMKEMGLKNPSVDENGYVTATLPGTAEGPVIGFIAHMDTAPDVSGKNVSPRIVKSYDGTDIALGGSDGTVLSPNDFPCLHGYVGQDLIVTDGTTLLGADDKAGIAEILSAVAYLKGHPEIPHGTVRIGFTPDEEIGRGADRFDVKGFDADWAYTVDGGPLGQLEYENFNAASAKVHIQGRSVHPGTAKNQMVNSIHIGTRLAQLMPLSDVPEKTEGYQGFIHLHTFEGTVEETTLKFIIRDHDKALFEEKKDLVRRAVSQVNGEFGDRLSLEIKDQYLNMREKIEKRMDIIDLAKRAMEAAGIPPLVEPIRGGTDGARLSYMGLPCPNIFTGGHNFHGKYEFIPVPSMERAVDVIVSIVKLAAAAKDR